MGKPRFSEFGLFLRDLYRKAGMKQKQFARALGVTPTYLWYVEKGEKNPLSLSLCKKAAKVLKLSQSESNELSCLALKNRSPEAYNYFPQDSSVVEGGAKSYQNTQVNVFGYIAAEGNEISCDKYGLPVGRVIETLARPLDVEGRTAYGLIMRGNGMLPGYPEGTRVLASTEVKVKKGDLVICRLKETDKTYIRRVGFGGEMIFLTADAYICEPIIALKEDVQFLHKVVWTKLP